MLSNTNREDETDRFQREPSSALEKLNKNVALNLGVSDPSPRADGHEFFFSHYAIFSTDSDH